MASIFGREGGWVATIMLDYSFINLLPSKAESEREVVVMVVKGGREGRLTI